MIIYAVLFYKRNLAKNLTPFTPYALRPSGFVAAVARAAVSIRGARMWDIIWDIMWDKCGINVG